MRIDNFYDVYERTDDVVFTDHEFTHDAAAFYWEDASETYKYPKHLSTTTWKRAKYEFADKSLFGSTGIRPADVRQGSIGNCWFMSAASAIAEYPGRMEQIFLNIIRQRMRKLLSCDIIPQ